MSAVVWVNDCPFSKVEKPSLPLDEENVRALYEELSGKWIELRDRVGTETASESPVSLALSSLEWACLRDCLSAVLQECNGDPVELEIRVGKQSEVEELRRRLEEFLFCED